MSRIRTHYDVLKVARDAPPEVIRAAYKTLTQKHHPDLNPEDDSATDRTSAFNRSYQVLSDPVRRARHDDWIAQEERTSFSSSSSATAPAPQPPPDAPPTPPAYDFPSEVSSYHAARSVGRAFGDAVSKLRARFMLGDIISVCALGILGIAIVVSNSPGSSKASHPVVVSESSPTVQAAISQRNRSTYVRPALDPNQRPWPSGADYLVGGNRQQLDGLSSVTVDNGQSDSDVHGKLFWVMDAGTVVPVREFFIPRGATFVLSDIAAGNYEIRYRDLSAGSISKSAAFELTEVENRRGTTYSKVSLTLYKIRNGNMKFQQIGEDEF